MNKKYRGGFLDTLLGTVGASLLKSMLAGAGAIKAGHGVNGVGQDF